jgi:predicted nuclease of predicted toxin-antitoxin system
MIKSTPIAQERIVITKDADFVDSFLTIGQPYKLLLVSTGNIKNAELESLFTTHLPKIIELLTQHSYIEINQTAIVLHQ